MTLVKTVTGSYVALADILEAIPARNDTFDLRLRLGGMQLVHEKELRKALERASRIIAPAFPGTCALQAKSVGEGVRIRRMPVVAWVVDSTTAAHPICNGRLMRAPDDYDAIQHPDGSVQAVHEIYERYDDWRASVQNDGGPAFPMRKAPTAKRRRK